jgi:hypothetical protein
VVPEAGVPKFSAMLHYRVAKEVEARLGERLVRLLSFQLPVTTPRRTWRRADVVAQRRSGAGDIACAEVATVNPNATAIDLIIVTSCMTLPGKTSWRRSGPVSPIVSILLSARCDAKFEDNFLANSRRSPSADDA